MANTARNVSVGKPKAAGAVYYAPAGTALPTDATTALANTYTHLGYVSEDGLTNADSRTVNEIKAWGGDIVLTSLTEKSDKFSFALIESLNVDVLKAVYGSANVSGTVATGATVRVNSTEPVAGVWVFDMVMTDNTLKRIVAPNAVISELGDISYKDDEAIGYNVTLTCMPGDSTFGYDTHKEYIAKPE